MKRNWHKTVLKYAQDSGCYFVADTLSLKFKSLEQEGGYYLQGEELYDHCWNILPDGTIVDATYQQFDSNVLIGIWSPECKEYGKYISFKRHYPKILKAIKQGKLTWSEIGLEESDIVEINRIKQDYNWERL